MSQMRLCAHRRWRHVAKREQSDPDALSTLRASSWRGGNEATTTCSLIEARPKSERPNVFRHS
eukprot:15467859-Alexandrium_andersonii.AAC.1